MNQNQPIGRLRPPTARINQFTVERESYSEVLTLSFPDGSSYIMEDLGALKLWMVQAGVNRLKIQLLLDTLWNFPVITYRIEDDNLKVH